MKSIQPLIVVGMHRSGTTMLTDLLEKLGIFMGKDLDHNHESLFFIKHNDWLLKECGGQWDSPKGMDVLLERDDLLDPTLDYLEYLMSHLPIRHYAGAIRLLSGDLPFNACTPWGWKDPRNTFTLPVWLKLFPNARVLHIYRNGVDVAASLQTRAELQLKHSVARYMLGKSCGYYNFKARCTGFTTSPSMLDIHKAFSLWEAYIEKVFSYEEMLGERMLNIRYEDFLREPAKWLCMSASFSGLDCSDVQANKLIGSIRSNRSFAFQKRPELVDFFEEVRSSGWMNKLGYTEL